jgi:hypothetical protein
VNRLIQPFLGAAALCAFCLTAQSDATEEILKRAIGLHQSGDIDGAIQAYERYLALRSESAGALTTTRVKSSPTIAYGSFRANEAYPD